jgi:hypothetical protein
MSTKINSLVSKFHSDEEGLEALQVVMIIAIAGMIMVAASTVGSQAVKWMGEKWNALKGQTISL